MTSPILAGQRCHLQTWGRVGPIEVPLLEGVPLCSLNGVMLKQVLWHTTYDCCDN